MTPEDFISHWSPGGGGYGMSERAGAQPHFIDLCKLLGVDTPNDADNYTFEKGTLKLGQKRGFADVFKRGCFAWEYKAPGGDLTAALRQLKDYANALDNPPLLIVSDRLAFEIHTQFTGRPTETYRLALKDFGDPAKRELLRRAFTDPASFQPKRTNRDITEQAAKAFADVAERMRHERREPPERVAHFLTQCLFCFFAEDVGLLPERLFEKLVAKQITPEKLRGALIELFEKMQRGGLFGTEDISWFNGGLFQKIDVPLITPMDVAALKTASTLNWSAIDVAIFGTLFERGLDPKKRSQLGAHYTDPATIMRIVTPVVERPLRAEWAVARDDIAKLIAKSKKHGDAASLKAKAALIKFLDRLAAYRVLDPACGSGNFLYLALKTLKDIEHSAHVEAETLGVERPLDLVTSPANVLGIELNEYAAELARVTVWIGELQWRLAHGYPFKQNPVLEPLDHIECRDALLSPITQQESDANSLPQRGRAGVGEPPEPTNQFNPAPLPDELRAFVRGLRNNATDAERALWQVLRGKQMGVKFRRQHPFAGYVLDFYCVELKLAVELDGGQHNLEPEQTLDEQRTAQLARDGIEVLRFWNDDVFKNLDGVWARIDEAITRARRQKLPPPAGEQHWPPPPAGKGGGGGTSHSSGDELESNQPPPQPSPAGGGSVMEAIWPRADAVIGNPPFVGDKKMRAELGDEYTETLRKVYEGRVPGGADLVTYWFEKAGAAIARGDLTFAGLVSTNSIRGGKNRVVLDTILESANIFEAWSDEPWVNDGAAVRVSLVAFGKSVGHVCLDGKAVDRIRADLTPDTFETGADMTNVPRLADTRSTCFVGTSKKATFDIDGSLARRWLNEPNVHGEPNADVLALYLNGADIARRPSDTWIVDFGTKRTLSEAKLFEQPYRHCESVVLPEKQSVRNQAELAKWWLHARPAPDMRNAIQPLSRFIATSIVAKWRLWSWQHPRVLPSHACAIVARADDATFGILHSRFHELWSLRLGTSLEDRPRYTPTTCFETFPFPEGLTPRDTAHQRTETLEDGSVIPALIPPPPAGEGGGGGRLLPDVPSLERDVPPPLPSPAGGGSHTSASLAGGASDASAFAAGVGSQVRGHAIARTAKRLNDLRERWLNPPEWTERVPEVIPLGMDASPYPDRILPRANLGATDLAELKKRTLTNLYNQRPAWLTDAHAALDAAVAAAYGWADYSPAMTDNEILARLLALNHARAARA